MPSAATTRATTSAAFPNHPHRGFETVTGMIAGRVRRRHRAGHQGLLENGGVQWMTAGRGLVHSELPEQEEGLMEGFQLWLNLPAKDKMREPWYRDIQSNEIPAFTPRRRRARARHCRHQPRHRGARSSAHTPSRCTWTSRCRPAPSSRSRCRTTTTRWSTCSANRCGSRAARCRRDAWRFLRTDPGSDGVVLRAGASNHSPARALLIPGPAAQRAHRAAAGPS